MNNTKFLDFCDFCLRKEVDYKYQICPLCDNQFTKITKLCDECMNIHLEIHEKNPLKSDNIEINLSEKCGDTGLF